jgi:hypothetical protein
MLILSTKPKAAFESKTALFSPLSPPKNTPFGDRHNFGYTL